MRTSILRYGFASAKAHTSQAGRHGELRREPATSDQGEHRVPGHVGEHVLTYCEPYIGPPNSPPHAQLATPWPCEPCEIPTSLLEEDGATVAG